MLQRLGAKRVGGLQRLDTRKQAGIQRFGKVNRARQLLHRVPKFGAGRFGVDHVALHVVARRIQLLHALLQLPGCILVFAKVVLQLVAKRNKPEQLLRLKQVAFLAGVKGVQMAAHVLNRLEGGAVFHADEVALHQPALHQVGRNGHLFTPECKCAVEPRLEGFALHVFSQQALHKTVYLVFNRLF